MHRQTNTITDCQQRVPILHDEQIWPKAQQGQTPETTNGSVRNVGSGNGTT
jgi:hypothetical protein